MNNKLFWIGQNLFLLGLYTVASWLCVHGQSGHWAVWLAAIILIAHVLEIPLAFRLLRERNPLPLRVVLGTFLFGFTWWLPARRGIYPVR